MKNETTDLRIFHGVFRKENRVPRESFTFIGGDSYVIVSIDHTQYGEEDKLILYSDSLILIAITDSILLFKSDMRFKVCKSRCRRKASFKWCVVCRGITGSGRVQS